MKSMSSWRALAVATALGSAGAGWGAAPERDSADPRTGGDTTVFAVGRHAFSLPVANLPDDERSRFVIGNSFFKRNWVEAPASSSARDGLGPHFIARSCAACHVRDGRGAPPGALQRRHEPPVALLLRLSVPGADARLGVRPEPTYGDQFSNAAVAGVKPEGEVTIRHHSVPGHFADGTRYSLRKPIYGFAKLAYGAMAPDVMVSPRIAPQLMGVGLLEAIAEADIRRNAAEQAAAGGAVRGVPNVVWDAYAGKPMIGRFGWKANTASLMQQTAAAFHGDIGITSSLFPLEACTSAQIDCLAARRGGALVATGAGQSQVPEVDDKTLAHVVFYQTTLAPAARREPANAQVRRGEKLFAQAQCAVCHRPSYVTAQGPFPALTSQALNGQVIRPYTDLLLHDMGAGLADHRPDFQANGRQWKTPALWGIGLIRDVNAHVRLLHDGRARGVLEAILWHEGEAEGSKQAVLKMSPGERAALVRFVESL